MTRWLSPAASYQTYPAEKKEKFKEEPSSNFRRAAFLSAALRSSLSQQLFSAAFLSSYSQQLFSAFLSSSSQQPFSSSSCQRPFSSSFSQQLFSDAFLTSHSQQLFSSCFSQQLFSTAFLSYHLAVVKVWWSAIIIILLWSRVGGQVCSRSLEGPFRNAFGKKYM